MRILTCFISPSSGSAKVHGYDVFDNPLEVRTKLGYLPQRAPLYTDMNVWEYLEFAGRVRGLDPSGFRTRLKKVVEVCGLAQVLGKDIGTLSHGYRQRVGLGQALIHDPPILILDEPTSDLDPNEKAEVIRYIKEIGKDRTVLLSTHNLSEVEEACARAIIVSKGKVVADGPLDEIRAKTGSTRYVVAVDEKNGEGGKPAPTATQLQDALAALTGAKRVREMPTDENAHRFELSGQQDLDLRAEIFRLVVQKHWTLLELRRDAQSLDTVFRELTRGDELLDRGAGWAETEDEDDDDDDDEAVDDAASEEDAASDGAAEDDKKEKSEG
jgi:ABC-2 type transport system ATP-binding protein